MVPETVSGGDWDAVAAGGTGLAGLGALVAGIAALLAARRQREKQAARPDDKAASPAES